MELTVIICTMPDRRQLLGRCFWYLERQSRDDFKVLVAHGKKEYGDKIMKAFRMVETSHLMMLDDDDWLSERHMEFVLPHDEDFVGYDAAQQVDGRFAEILPQEIASHICPIRTDLATQIPFGNDYFGDIGWTKQVAKLIETSAYIDEPLYYYDKWNKPGGGWSPTRQVGNWPHDQTRWQWI